MIDTFLADQILEDYAANLQGIIHKSPFKHCYFSREPHTIFGCKPSQIFGWLLTWLCPISPTDSLKKGDDQDRALPETTVNDTWCYFCLTGFCGLNTWAKRILFFEVAKSVTVFLHGSAQKAEVSEGWTTWMMVDRLTLQSTNIAMENHNFNR